MQAILFDLDGTLVDTAPDVHRAINYARGQLGLPPLPLEEALKAIGPGADRFAATVLGEKQAHLLEPYLEIFRPYYLRICAERSRPFPGIVALLESLRAYRLAVVTNKRLVQSRALLRAIDLDKYFKLLVGPELVHHIKPAPDMILHALDHFGIDPDQALMVGDTDNDLLAAQAAGVACCGVGWGYADSDFLKSLRPDHFIETPEELLPVLAAYNHN
ncbi:MAG TPA: HAD-IA family hydrolase [bacterium]|nr:HAD-IA family hydrolase [bacterium]HQG44533.1 HAD-IA family hydrolase [bacterium]HQI47635.1 HAD-IA family hydrolase [bacterium]HQJ63241.1 HAD-IA family hydrolase [bacterium]